MYKLRFLFSISLVIFYSCSHMQKKVNNREINKIFFANSEIEIKDSILFYKICEEIDPADSIIIHSNLDYNKQLLCEKLGDTLIHILKLSEENEYPFPFSSSDVERSNANIDSISPQDSLQKFALYDIILVNTSQNTTEALVIGLNEFDLIDYSNKIDNLCFYPIAINEGLLLDENNQLDPSFRMLFFMNSGGLGEKDEIFSIDRKIYKHYFDELGFVTNSDALIHGPSKCDFRTLINFYSFIINNGIVKNYNLIGRGSEIDKTNILNPNVFSKMKSIPYFTKGLVVVSYNTVYCFASNENYILCIKIKLLNQEYSFDYKEKSGKCHTRFPFHGIFYACIQINLKIQEFFSQFKTETLSE